MKKNTGYREMLRDRCPKVVSFALKWCKAKEKWLDYVYKEQVWPLKSKEKRLEQTKAILGIKNGKQNFNFHDTIFWKGLTNADVYYWTYVEEWVNFFVSKFIYIENMYVNSLVHGKSIADVKLEIMKNWLIQLCPTQDDDEKTRKEKSNYVNNLTDYLIDCFEGNIQ